MPLRGGAVLLTALIVLLTPHLDAIVGHWAQHGVQSSDVSIPAAAGRQTARFAVLVTMIATVGSLWATPFATALGVDLGGVARTRVRRRADHVGSGVSLERGRRGERARLARGSRGGRHRRRGAGRTAYRGWAPSFRCSAASASRAILALALLSILVSIGVNVWPLITGLSVFGLAIGFGSQTLVKDVVSGLFFLIDDAFRFGEYIETTGAKGTVEKISIRSVSLRHQRGALATIPYGQIGKIQNFSRDWMIEKLTFRVAFDTDVEKVRKIFKKIGQEIAADPELAGDLLEPFKSQGIAEVEDGTLVIRAKFKAKAGKQTMIRRAALTAVHRAFQENGIHAVPKPLTNAPAVP